MDKQVVIVYLRTNLIWLRMQNNISQKQMGLDTGIGLKTLSHAERGRQALNYEQLYRVAHYFSITIDDLLFKNLIP